MRHTSKSLLRQAMLGNPHSQRARLRHKLFPFYATRMHYFQINAKYRYWTVGDFLKYRARIGQGPGAPTAEEVWLLELAVRFWADCTKHRGGSAVKTAKLLKQFKATPGNCDNYSVIDAFSQFNTGRIRI